MKKIGTLLLILMVRCAFAQDYANFTSTVSALEHPATQNAFESLWHELVADHKIPLVVGDSVAFLYRGEARDVSWLGDFNSWSFTPDCHGTRIAGTDLWILKSSFPIDSRFDYKIVVDQLTRKLDPSNPNRQWSGLGGGSPNSELRMPEWKVDPITVFDPSVPQGKVYPDILLDSKVLGYQIMYSVYLPPAVTPSDTLPVVYVTDGYEYMNEHMGNMVTILNNLIAQKKILPIAAVFVDQREPANRDHNRTMQELTMNKTYLDFFTKELIPAIEANFPVSHWAKHRAILGNTMGGLTAAYFAFADPAVFGLAGIQSPAFWMKSDIYALCDNPDNPPVKVFMTSGLYNDAASATRRMKEILDRNTCSYQYREVDQGASWGNWRDLIDDILIYFFPAE